MAQFDVHRFGDTLVIDCQSDLLDHVDSRFVVPLVARREAPAPAPRLNPVFAIEGEGHVMLTEAAGAVSRRALGEVVATLANRSFEITGALDVLISGV